MSASRPTLEERVAHLERNAETDATLASAVDRLVEEATGLNSILARVDQQQTDLTDLGKELKAFKERAATTDDVAASEEAQHAARRRVLIRVVTTIALTAAALGGALAYTTNQGYHACQKQQKRVNIQQAFYQSVSDQIPRSDRSKKFHDSIDAAILNLEKTRDDCEHSYPVHWGADT